VAEFRALTSTREALDFNRKHSLTALGFFLLLSRSWDSVAFRSSALACVVFRHLVGRKTETGY